MDEDFFADQGETVTITTQPTQNINASQVNMEVNEDQFQFQNSNDNIPPSSNDNIYAFQNIQEDQAIRKVREEQEKLLEALRLKANKEYEQKQKRKESGRLQLQQFLQQKDKEMDQRKIANKEKQVKTKQENQTNVGTGWKKVAINIPLKQGQHPGRKDVNRMRQAIINKRNDEL